MNILRLSFKCVFFNIFFVVSYNCNWSFCLFVCLFYVFFLKKVASFNRSLLISKHFLKWRLGTNVKRARCTVFDSGNILKIVIFPSIVTLRILHNLRIFWMSRTTLQKSFSFWMFLLHEKWTPNIFTVSDVNRF